MPHPQHTERKAEAARNARSPPAATPAASPRRRPRSAPSPTTTRKRARRAGCGATTPVPEQDRAGHLRLALENAVRGGRDADTVAAIAGGLLGAGRGTSAVPVPWRLMLHGWPGLTAPDLIALATAIAESSR